MQRSCLLEFRRGGGIVHDLRNLIGVQQVIDVEVALALGNVFFFQDRASTHSTMSSILGTRVGGSVIEQPIPDGRHFHLRHSECL
jgi:hypothetical protein